MIEPMITIDQLMAQLQMAVNSEREACAEIAEQYSRTRRDSAAEELVKLGIAATIRARGNVAKETEE